MTGIKSKLLDKAGLPLVDRRPVLWGFLVRLRGDALVRNSFFLMLASGSSAVLGFLFWIVVARFYTAADLGLASALVSAISLLSLFSNLGFHAGLIRFLPQEKDKGGMINTSMTVVALVSVLVAVVFLLSLSLWSPSLLFLRQNMALLIGFVLFTAITPFLYMHRSAFVSFNASEYYFIEQVVYMGLRILLVVVMVSFGASGIFSSWGISLVLGITAGFLFLRRVQPQYAPVPVVKKKIISGMFHFSFGNYLAETVGNAPPFILPLAVIGMLGAEMNAYYYIAYTMSSALLMIPTAISISLFASGSNEPEKLRASVIKAARFLAFSLLPAVAFFFLLGDKLLWLFGGEYSTKALQLLWLLSFSTIFTAANFLYIGVQQARTNMRAVVLVSGSAAIFTLVASYFLMKWAGLPGIGWGWVIGQGMVSLIIGLNLLGKKVILKKR